MKEAEENTDIPIGIEKTPDLDVKTISDEDSRPSINSSAPHDITIHSCDMSMASSISIVLLQLIHENLKKPNFKDLNAAQKKSAFNSKKVPKISIGDYLHRIKKFTKCEDEVLIVGLIYLDRICKKKKYVLTMTNIYRLYFTSVIMAIKFLQDKFYTNKYYAQVGGVTLQELNHLEEKFLQAIDFHLLVDIKIFNKYNEMISEN